MDAKNLKRNEQMCAKSDTNKDKEVDKVPRRNIHEKLTLSKSNNAENRTNETIQSKENCFEHETATNKKGDNIFKTHETEKKKSIDIKHPTINRNQNIKDIRAEDVGLSKRYQKELAKVLSLEDRKRIRDKYTITMKNSNQNTILNKKDDFTHKIGDARKMDIKNDLLNKKQSNETLRLIASVYDHKNPRNKDSTKVDSMQRKEEIQIQRKPVIKTITTKNDTARYKAVMFIDQKRDNPTPLQINIPNEASSPKKAKISNFIDSNQMETKLKSSASKMSIKEKSVMNRKKKRQRKFACMPSPDYFLKQNTSPPTEVAKWAPCSINDLTKPYYEAWVDTTLAAISRNTKKDKLFLEKQNIIQTFKRILEERPTSPELVYENYANEKYTGKIKINKR